MKKITKSSFAFIISMFFLIAITSCEKEEAAVGKDDLSGETEQDFSGSLIRVMGETSGGGTTKTTLEGLETWWKGADEHGVNADKVGIYSPQALPDPKEPAGVVNSEFTADATGKSSDFTGTMYWGSGDHSFYSYYPYSAGEADRTAVPISLPSAQTQSAGGNSDHIGVLDFMVATPLTGVSPGGAGDETSGVTFQYNHVFTLLEFQVTGTGTLSKVKLAGPGTLAFGDGTIDITQGTPDAGVAYTIDNIN
ncbi:MAG: fimbrillin family protein, partial [Bacteroidales bacterium]